MFNLRVLTAVLMAGTVAALVGSTLADDTFSGWDPSETHAAPFVTRDGAVGRWPGQASTSKTLAKWEGALASRGAMPVGYHRSRRSVGIQLGGGSPFFVAGSVDGSGNCSSIAHGPNKCLATAGSNGSYCSTWSGSYGYCSTSGNTSKCSTIGNNQAWCSAKTGTTSANSCSTDGGSASVTQCSSGLTSGSSNTQCSVGNMDGSGGSTPIGQCSTDGYSHSTCSVHGNGTGTGQNRKTCSTGGTINTGTCSALGGSDNCSVKSALTHAQWTAFSSATESTCSVQLGIIQQCSTINTGPPVSVSAPNPTTGLCGSP